MEKIVGLGSLIMNPNTLLLLLLAHVLLLVVRSW
jgi:hypothetical protein